MGFLDKVKDTANKTVEQAKQATAAGKEKYEDHNLQKKINELQQEIGALVVAQRRNDAPDDAAGRIDVKIAEIGELEAQMASNSPGAEGSSDAAAS
jgi:hypothetical protein